MIRNPAKLDQLQLRKVAILVGTLDESLADRLLADMPARDAAAVEQMVAEMEDVDPAEYRAVLEDFHRGLASRPRKPERPTSEPPLRPHREQQHGVELDESLLARLEAEEGFEVPPTTARQTGPWQALSDADADTLVEMLSAVQPQTIAVVFSRLDAPQAAELIGKLSPTLQAEVLSRLADLDPADEQTLHVVESQLANWIEQQRQRRQRMSAGRELVQRILHSTPDSQRAALLARLSKQNPGLADSMSLPQRDIPVTAQLEPKRRMNLPVAKRKAMDGQSLVDSPAVESGDPLRELESLNDPALLKALQVADRQTVLFALAGASEELMKRIMRGLTRRSANQFRQQVRSIGPVRLSEMTAAQRELVRCSQS